MKKEKLLQVETPSYVVSEELLIKNLEILKSIEERTGCKILLAQKAFSMFSLYPIIKKYISGATASGLYEARLGFEEMGRENHVFSPAFTEKEFPEIMRYSDHIVFNSFEQWQKFKLFIEKSNKKISVGIRVNPEKSTQKGHGIYDPCGKFSRLGVTHKNFRENLLDGIDGLHFHTLCEQNSDDLEVTLEAFEDKFGKYLYNMKWVNFGGGHHITREDYDIEKLVFYIEKIQKKYGVHVYIEPGEAVVLNTGFLVSTVLEIVQNEMEIAILDTSAACHMPDVIEMPYRPPVLGSFMPNEKPFTYRFAGPTCLAGDVIGDYSFENELKVGDKVIFGDMALYSMVKNNTFNGMALPNITIIRTGGKIEVIKRFSYEDFKNRLS